MRRDFYSRIYEGDVLIKNFHTGTQDFQYMSPCVFSFKSVKDV